MMWPAERGVGPALAPLAVASRVIAFLAGSDELDEALARAGGFVRVERAVVEHSHQPLHRGGRREPAPLTNEVGHVTPGRARPDRRSVHRTASTPCRRSRGSSANQGGAKASA
jgi:hypothetical protein